MPPVSCDRGHHGSHFVVKSRLKRANSFRLSQAVASPQHLPTAKVTYRCCVRRLLPRPRRAVKNRTSLWTPRSLTAWSQRAFDFPGLGDRGLRKNASWRLASRLAGPSSGRSSDHPSRPIGPAPSPMEHTLKAHDIAAPCLKRQRRIEAGGNQAAAQVQHRCGSAPHLVTDERGIKRLVSHPVSRR